MSKRNDMVRVRVLAGQRVLLNSGAHVEAGGEFETTRTAAGMLVELKIVEMVPAGKSAQESE